MALYTSFLFKSVQLNDGTTYSIPLADQGLDDRNSTEATWAYRKDNSPVQTQLTIKEGVFTLNINIVAAHGETAAQYEAKIDTLKKIFNTKDKTFYQLQRQLPHEGSAKYLSVAPREVHVDRLQRKVSVTFQTADKEWQETALQTATVLLFDGAPRTETLTINYTGLSPVEPVISIQAVTPGSDGPVPLYWRQVTTFTHNSQHILNSPIRIVSGWDTSALVSGGKMRADGLDITVTLPDGTPLKRYVGGSAASRTIWVSPQVWPSWSTYVLVNGPEAAVGAALGIAVLAADTKMYLQAGLGQTIDLPASGYICLDDEIIHYSAVAAYNAELSIVELTLDARGALGTAAADHYRFTPTKRPLTLKVNYGYAAGYTVKYGNDLTGWYLIDYETSTNKIWNQTIANTSPFYSQSAYFPGRPLSWTGILDWMPSRIGENIQVTTDSNPAYGAAKMQIYGTYVQGGGKRRDRLVVQQRPYQGRQISQMRFVLKVKGGAAPYPTVTLKLMKVRDGFALYNNEVTEEVWSYNVTSSIESTVDTGYLDLDNWFKPGTHYFFRLVAAAPGGPIRNLLLDEVYYKPDYDSARWPVVSALGSEGGASAGEYPTYLSSIINTSDAGNPQAFSVYTKQATGQTAVIDCAERTVSGGMTFNECSFQNPIWLRLVPGSNVISFTGPTGAGQMQVTLQWRNRY